MNSCRERWNGIHILGSQWSSFFQVDIREGWLTILAAVFFTCVTESDVEPRLPFTSLA